MKTNYHFFLHIIFLLFFKPHFPARRRSAAAASLEALESLEATPSLEDEDGSEEVMQQLNNNSFIGHRILLE